jgi:hypothetical protein
LRGEQGSDLIVWAGVEGVFRVKKEGEKASTHFFFISIRYIFSIRVFGG